MGEATISLGLGLGGGKASTISGRPAGGGSFSNTYSVDFDGTDDYVALGTNFAPFNFGTGEFTVTLWAYPHSLHTVTYQALIGTHYISGTVWGAYMRSDGIFIYGGGALTGGGTLADDTWHHCVFTRNSGTVTVYLNGSSVASVSNSNNYNSSSNMSRIGDDVSSSNPPFNGLIDEVACWKSGVSASDVTAIYNSGVPADLSSYNPEGYWRMGDNDGGTGTTITDQGSGGNDGTFEGPPTFSTNVPS